MPLVKIRRGTGNTSPLFCIPGAAASVLVFNDLSHAIEPRFHVYGLQPKGLDGVLSPYRDVVTAAEDHVRTIRETQIHGPYNLMGHSFGGWIAFEVALQLLSHNQEIGNLFVVDSRTPSESMDEPCTPSLEQTINKLIEIVNLRLSTPIDLDFDDIQLSTFDTLIALLHQKFVGAGLLHSKSSPKVLHGVIRVLQANMSTIYTPNMPLRGVLQLFTAEYSAVNPEFSINGWRNHATVLDHVQLPGNHVTVLLQPNVAVLARHVNDKLRVSWP
jgi:thioesterase domain-containing protein